MEEFIGKYVIVRDHYAGVLFGILESYTEKNTVLSNMRKLYYWSGANTIEQIAEEGVKDPKNCKFTQTIEGKSEACFRVQLIPCTKESIENIKNVPIWKN